MIAYFLGGCAIYGIVLFVLVMLRPKSALHTKKLTDCGRREKIIIGVVLVILILLCILPMGLAPGWNGEDPGATNQYELLAEAILNGHISIDNGDVDPLLLQMDNPYDPQARVDLGVDYRWDTAYYHGHYYMYFGVVPVFLLFLPFRLITGMSLTTYHATQVFVALFICGVFANFYMMSKRFFKKMTLGMYLMLASAFSIMSVWYSVDAPALYCTAITGALCMEIWSLFFFMRAVWVEEDEKKSIRLAFFGSLFGALAFGCRPPVALANLFVIPMLVVYLKKHKFTKKLFGELVVAALPYVVIGIFLMCYNYARFESPFEFGQAYQLTAADQSNYGSIASYFSQTKMIAVANAVLSKGFEIETEMSIHAIDKNMFVENVVITYRDRPEGSVSKLDTYSDGFKVLKTIARLYRAYKPMGFFGIIALILAVIATAFFIPVMGTYLATGLVPDFPTLIVCGFTMLSAIQSLVVGVTLETMAQKNRQDFEMQLQRVTAEKKRLCGEKNDAD